MAKKEIAVNYHVTFNYYLEQISKCDNWCKEAESLLESNGTQAKALELITTVENDPEGDMKLIDVCLYERVKAHCFSKIFDFPSG